MVSSLNQVPGVVSRPGMFRDLVFSPRKRRTIPSAGGGSLSAAARTASGPGREET